MRDLDASELLQLVLDHIPGQCVSIFDTNLRYLHAFGPLLGVLGLSPNDIIGKTVHEVAEHPERGAELAAYYYRVFGQSTTESPMTFAFERANLHLEVTCVAIFKDGRLLGGMAHTRDVSHRRRNEMTLEALSITDSLTRLANRRKLERELIRLRPQTTLLLLDLDGFKKLNDFFGHSEGDAVLVRVARSLESTVRPYDLVCRIGGDEFVVLLPETTLEEAQTVVERIKLAVPQTGPVGVSIGMAQYPLEADTPRKLMDLADSRMYVDKQSKRRRDGSTQRLNKMKKSV